MKKIKKIMCETSGKGRSLRRRSYYVLNAANINNIFLIRSYDDGSTFLIEEFGNHTILAGSEVIFCSSKKEVKEAVKKHGEHILPR